MSDNTLKVRLLAHSQNMIIAAENKQWQQLVVLDSQWHELLKNAITDSVESVQEIQLQLQENNQKLQKILLSEQKKLFSDKAENRSSHNAIKQYLK